MSDADLSNLLPEMLPRLWAFALRISGDRHDAEDLVQLACLRALERAHQLQPGLEGGWVVDCFASRPCPSWKTLPVQAREQCRPVPSTTSRK
jgi:Sigma-70 region 2